MAAPAAALTSVALDAFTAVYHRPSGITHLLTAPAPEMLAAMADDALTADEILVRLAARYEVGDAASLTARLDELVASGLVSAVRGAASRLGA